MASLLLPVLMLAGCADHGISFLWPHGPVASAQRGYFFDILLILLAVVLPVFVFAPLFAWRYRYGKSTQPYRPNWSFSWPLEILAWGVPCAVVIVLSIWLWHGTHKLDPYSRLSPNEKALPVEVVGYDWKWLFLYPTLGVASVGQFPLPAERPISIKLTSDTVLQSFFIPALGSQIYAMAGMVTRLNLKSRTTGSYLGENMQYNGMGFQHQRFQAIAMTPASFRDWVRRARTIGVPLTPKVYATLADRNTVGNLREALHAEHMPDGAIYFRDVRPGLFANIVTSFHGGSKKPADIIRGR